MFRLRRWYTKKPHQTKMVLATIFLPVLGPILVVRWVWNTFIWETIYAVTKSMEVYDDN